MNHISLSAVTTFAFIAASSFAAPESQAPSSALKVEIVNQTGVYQSNQIYLGIRGKDAGTVSTDPPIVTLTATDCKLSATMSDLTVVNGDQNHRSFTLHRAPAVRVLFSLDNGGGGGGVHSGQDPTAGTFAPPFLPPYNNLYTCNPYSTDNPPPRFDKIELSFDPTTGTVGAANLTAVDFYGIPFKMETLDAHGNTLDQVSFLKNHTTIYDALRNKAGANIAAVGLTYAPGQAPPSGSHLGGFARFLSPQSALSVTDSSETAVKQSWDNAKQYMADYVNDVLSKSSHVRIAGNYAGSALNSRPACDYDYTGSFSSSGQITLTPNPCSCAQNYNCPTCPHPPGQNLTISLSASQWVNAIFAGSCSWTVGNQNGDFNDNDYYAAIVRDLLAAFNYGYVNGIYNRPQYSPSQNDSTVWYGLPYCPPFSCAQPNDFGWYNPYAGVLSEMTDAYGFSFTDKGFKPLVNLTNKVDTLRITILDDLGLEAPTITSASAGTFNDEPSITVTWDAAAGAANYEVSITPPFPARVVTTGQTSYTFESPSYVLNPGTPYEISVAAVNSLGTKLSSKPVVVSTGGSPGQNFPSNATLGVFDVTIFMPLAQGNYTNHKLTFNGCEYTLQEGYTHTFVSVPGATNTKNSYVLKWTDPSNQTVFESNLIVETGDLDATAPTNGTSAPPSCNGSWPIQSNCGQLIPPANSPCYLLVHSAYLMNNSTAAQISPDKHGVSQNLEPLPNPIPCSSGFGTSCAADLDASGQVDGLDFNALLANWGQSGTGDINRDGIVAGADIVRMLSAWGPCGD